MKTIAEMRTLLTDGTDCFTIVNEDFRELIAWAERARPWLISISKLNRMSAITLVPEDKKILDQLLDELKP